MKKLMSLMLGLAFLGGTIALADEATTKDTTKTKATKATKAKTKKATTDTAKKTT
jgi:Ni/Co efflux regulator RcnB